MADSDLDALSLTADDLAKDIGRLSYSLTNINRGNTVALMMLPLFSVESLEPGAPAACADDNFHSQEKCALPALCRTLELGVDASQPQ